MLTFRLSTDHDLLRATEIWRRAVEATHHFLAPLDKSAIDAELLEFFPQVSLELAVDAAGTPQGFMFLHDGHLKALLVDPDQHGKGIGKALISRAIEQLVKSNLHRGPSPDLHRFAFELKSAGGATIGGLMGRTAYDWPVIELLYVPGSMRGTCIGRRLVGKAEELARNRQCIGIWLDTFGFQAPGFYLRLGYEVFGELSDNPVGQSRYFLRKLLT